ncbi:Acyl dehydratase [Methylophaga frappieri]|uniref:Acyl dehydratase n=1 Tax=Methylophaga frappieri (strain ATCC BAA-2434 / DSM 25690 / JAM7) TaxID=754477 RepID=I1YH63_METFJ|nr:MaoC family dehydratase [Methylophaga frappieri]AFJ02256.1 Acyl dehydratase [Methylophaga frappieri]
MRLVESLKHGQEKIESMNAGLRLKVEATLRELPNRLNRTLTDMRNISLPWGQLLFWQTPPETHETIDPLIAQRQVMVRLQQQFTTTEDVGDWYTLNQKSIDRFASVTGDMQWIHTDPQRAATESPFKSTVAHGFLTLSLIPMLTDSVDPKHNPYPEAKMVVNTGLEQVRFLSPVKPGMRIRANSRIIDIREMKRSIELVREVTIEIENSKRVACIAQLVMRLYF